MTDADFNGRFERLERLIAPPVVGATGSGPPQNATEAWHASPSNGEWLAQVIHHPIFKLAVQVTHEVHKPIWGMHSGQIPAQDALVNSALELHRLQGFHDFCTQLELLTHRQAEPPGPLPPEFSDEHTKEWARQKYGIDLDRVPPEPKTESPETE